MKLTAPIFILALAVFAGCGSRAAQTSKPSRAATVGNCLNDDESFLVEGSNTSIVGQSPRGVSFSLKVYKTQAAARAAYRKKDPQTTALVERGVVDFKGNPSPYVGAPPAKISKVDLAAINRCIRKAKK